LAPAPCNAKEGAPALSYSQKGVRRSKANEARGQLVLFFFIFYHWVHFDSSEACPPLARSLPASCNAKVREYSVLFLSLKSPNSGAPTRFNLVGAPLCILCERASLSSENKIKYKLRTPIYRENGVPAKFTIPKCTNQVFLRHRLVKYQENTNRYQPIIPNQGTTLERFLLFVIDFVYVSKLSPTR
jgi:hypothetical protein